MFETSTSAANLSQAVRLAQKLQWGAGQHAWLGEETGQQSCVWGVVTAVSAMVYADLVHNGHQDMFVAELCNKQSGELCIGTVAAESSGMSALLSRIRARSAIS